MILRGDAVRFDGIAAGGRNDPLLIEVETASGDVFEAYLKVSGRPELSETSLANEVISVCVAQHVGLPVCAPILVNITNEWIESIADPALREVLRRSSPIGFGSTRAGDGWVTWNPEDTISAGRRQVALETFAFDLFIENPDRTPIKPNILVKGDEFRLIDHELALMVLGPLFPPPQPWAPGYANRMTQPGGHIFGPRLRGLPLDLTMMKAKWASLSDAVLGEYENWLPAEWGSSAASVTAAVAHLRCVRDRIDDCLAEIGRALT